VHGFEHGSAKTRALCARLYESRSKLWAFVSNESVEPTNNRAERAVRPAVLLRKNSYGNDSVAGARFIERLLCRRWCAGTLCAKDACACCSTTPRRCALCT
jgi:hypothetical protein